MSKTRETAKGNNIDPDKPHTDPATTSEDNPNEDPYVAENATKEDYQGETESLSSNDLLPKDKSGDEDFELGTSNLDNEEEDKMESNDNVPKSCKRKNKG